MWPPAQFDDQSNSNACTCPPPFYSPAIVFNRTRSARSTISCEHRAAAVIPRIPQFPVHPVIVTMLVNNISVLCWRALTARHTRLSSHNSPRSSTSCCEHKLAHTALAINKRTDALHGTWSLCQFYERLCVSGVSLWRGYSTLQSHNKIRNE